MSTTTHTADQDALRVANRYASLVEKAETLQDRARACHDAAQQYRRDARANTESAQNHRTAARTIRDAALAHQHAMAARDTEAEAAREILAARYYEQQAETYEAQAHGITPAGAAAGGPVLDDRREATGHYDSARGRALQGVATDDPGKEAMTASAGAALPDAAGLAQSSSENWHGSDAVTGVDGKQAWVSLFQQDDTSAYVVVATKPAGAWEPESLTNGGIDPSLSVQEADRLAGTLDELVDAARSGTVAAAPTKVEKMAARIRGLLGSSGVSIIGDDGEIQLSAADIRTLLDAAAPEPAVATRRKVAAKDCAAEGLDTGAVWAELDTSGAEPVIAVTSTEGEQPEDYPEGYTTTTLSLDEAAQLAAKVRRFAAAAPQAGVAAAQPAPPAAPEPSTQPAAAGPRRVTSPAGRTYEYDPDTGATAVIEPDGWSAVVPPSSSTGTAARLLYWNAEIRAGRGADATEEAARALLDGMSAAELREVAEAIGSSAVGARTKPQLVKAIVTTAIASPRKHRALTKG